MTDSPLIKARVEKLNIPQKAKSDDRRTPSKLYQKYNEIYKFDIDLAASEENTKCAKFYSKENSALDKTWRGSCWMNPPYDVRTLEAFTKKAIEERDNYEWCVMLLPCKCDQQWWHDLWNDYMYLNTVPNRYIGIEWVKGRIKFEGPGCTTTTFIPGVVVIIKGGGVR
jgi:phage N-6-adenine-methyltransferase